MTLGPRIERYAPDLLPVECASAIWKKARLHRDSHIQVGGAFYSAAAGVARRASVASRSTSSVSASAKTTP